MLQIEKEPGAVREWREPGRRSRQMRAIPAEMLRVLYARSDLRGAVRTLAHVGLLVAGATLVHVAVGHWWLPAALLLQGVFLVSLFAAMHECVHASAFRTRRLNDVVGWMAGLGILFDATYYRHFHFAHHRYTQDPARDPELLTAPPPRSRREYWWRMTAIPYWQARLASLWRLSRGRFDGLDFIGATARPEIVRSVRGTVLVLAALLAGSLALRSTALLWYWLLPLALGLPLLRLYLLTEHTGCSEDDDAFGNTRTTISTRVVRFLMWNLPYHAEHHLYPSIPFHQLPLAHRWLRGRLRVVSPGYVATNRALHRVLPLLALALLGAAVVSEAQVATPAPHDPYQGMEPSGRIPKVALPEDLPNPERWRYLPEGRIKPGNIFERFLVSTFVAPQFFFEQDVGAGGGLAFTDIDFRNERRREFLGAFLTYTTEGQQKYRLIWRRWLEHRDMPGGGVIVEERTHLDAFGGYEKSLTRRFFGLGPDTRERDETSYTDEFIDLGARVELAVPEPGGSWIATGGIRGEHHDLLKGRVSGRSTTDQTFKGQFDAGNHHDSLILSTGFRYDTRDSQHQPYRGWQLGVLVDAPVWQSNGDTGAVTTAFASAAFPVPPLFHGGGDDREENPPTDTIALGMFVQATAGDLPFYMRPSLGGTYTLRGYIQNRFTDNAAWHAVAEYRFAIIPRGFALTDTIRIERIGLAPFVEVGTVAESLRKLPDARVHASYGIGLRFALERTAVFRADVGFSDEGVNVSVGFGLPF